MKCDELKAFNCVDSDLREFCEPRLVYSKSEADKVIAELKDKCQMHDFFWDGCGFAKRGFKNAIAVSEAYDFLESENAQLKESIAVYQRNEKADIRELRHQKYKRCLAMALLCFTKGKEKQSVYKLRTFFWSRWGNRWSKLAKKFKEAK